jgi:WD40 repeat protein/predicted Ser/Thr protein kinase
MEFEDTSGSRRERSSDPRHAPHLLDTETLRPDALRGLETRRQKAMIAAALFDETPTPIKIGRFTIVRELGAGGMGVVYVAYDEQLDRRVAVKLLRGSESDVEAKLRLQREAQAMARLSHPNVVTVHEVGTFQDQVFVAMEFVDGQDLRAWSKAERRDWRSIVAIFNQAGEGLAAAHDGGIVHRDFKPDNVLVGKDGRVRVADFGLAHAFDATTIDSAEARVTVDDSDVERSGGLEGSLTKTGTIMGTPAYMAPEQFEGSRTDARSDQFCFCVALWEGLYGRRPFSGPNLIALSNAVMDGRIDPPPADAEVPAWLHAVLIRGLSPRAEDRWPSMRALLDALAKDPEIRRKRAVRSTALASVGATVLAGLVWLTGTSVAQNARQRYWNGLTEQLLEIERERGFRQASDDAQRARDATRMSVYRSYRPKGGLVDHEDPTVAAVLLREVEGSARGSEAWVSAANEILGRPISKAVLAGHDNLVVALAFTADGGWLYSGSADGTVRRWDPTTGRDEVIITHDRDVTALALAHDGSFVVSGSKDGTVREWTVATGVTRTIAEHDDEIMSIVPSVDGRRVLTASKNGTAKVHQRTSGAAPLVLRGHRGPVNHAVFDAEERRVLTVSSDHRARIWPLDGGAPIILEGHSAPVFHGRFLDERRVLTASDDGDVRLWQLGGDVPNGEVIARHGAAITALDVHEDRVLSSAEDGSVRVSSIDGRSSISLKSHDNGVWAAEFLPSGDSVVTASFDGTARWMSADGSGVPLVFTGHRLALFRLAVAPNGRWLATGSYDGSIRLWDLTRPRLEIPLEGHTRPVYTAELSPDGNRVVTASRDGTARVWNAIDGSSLAVLSGGNESLNEAEFSPDGQRIAAATKRGVVEMWDLATGTNQMFHGHVDSVWDVDFDAAGERLASASFDGTARIWNVATGAELQVLHGHRDMVVGVDFTPDGTGLVTVSHDATLRFWDVQSGLERGALEGHEGKINMVVRSPDQVVLATASEDGTARLWPDETSEHSIVLRGHANSVWSVAFNADGSRVVTASFDGTARVWSVDDGSLLATLDGHAEGLWSAVFVADGRVVTSSDDNTIRVWSVDSAVAPIVLTGHGDGVTSLAASGDGVRLVSASADGSAKIWRLDRLTSDGDALYGRLIDSTSFCLPVDQRVRELGEDRGEAELAMAACKRQLGL